MGYTTEFDGVFTLDRPLEKKHADYLTQFSKVRHMKRQTSGPFINLATFNQEALTLMQGEKFYEYIEWIQYLIGHFLQPWGYVVNGVVRWRGEEFDDTGVISVRDNEVHLGTLRAMIPDEVTAPAPVVEEKESPVITLPSRKIKMRKV